MKEADRERFDALLSWAQRHGASLHPALEIYRDDLTGFSVRCRPGPRRDDEADSLRPGDEVLVCPLETSLSYLNARTGEPLLATTTTTTTTTPPGPPPVFPPAFYALPPHVVGRFFLMREYLAGEASFWHPYLATLPQPDAPSAWGLPPFWPDDDAALLACTNTGISAQAIREQLRAEFREARGLLRAAGRGDWRDYTRALHDWAFSIFASRSFRPSLVLPATLAARALPQGVAADDFSILLPVFDIINHSPRARVRWLPGGGEGRDAHTCRLQTFDACRPGDQVFNSYGRKTNSELLLSYGFVLPEGDDAHNDYFHVRKRAAAGGGPPPPPPLAGAGPPGPPQDFLVSLRPIHHPGSHVGAARQLVARDRSFDVRPEFSHVEDSLVWDLCLAVAGDGHRESFVASVLGPEPAGAPGRRELACLGRVLSASAPLPAEAEQVVGQVRQLLLAKLGMEYDKLCQTDPGTGVDEQGNEVAVEVVPRTRNQSVALQYRKQVRRVLENAISTLAPGWQDEGAQEP